MKTQTTPEAILAEYRRGMRYKHGIDLPETVKRNRNFYMGKQWEGVKAPDLDKPVFNILGRVVSYFIAMLVSDDIAVSIEPFGMGGEGDARIFELAAVQLRRIIEENDMRILGRDALRDMAVEGDMCLHAYFDPEAPTGQAALGRIRAELIDSLHVIFGNPYSRDKEGQPYILLAQPKRLEDLRREAIEGGLPPEEVQGLGGAEDFGEDREETGLVLIKYWKQGGTVWYTKVAGEAVLKPPTDTGYRRYPIAWQSWTPVKNSYHGRAAITELIPNQIMINKLFAMALKAQVETAFPKILYDGTRIERWSNQIGAIRVNGDPGNAVAAALRGADLSPTVISLIEAAIAYTRDLMGASDAALGNVTPHNTSAIIAVQKATAIPLELQKIAYYQFVEDYVRIFLDMATVDYGLRMVTAEEWMDFSALRDRVLSLQVDIGAGTYFSEIAQVQTLDNLYDRGIITDPVTYVENIPEGYIRNRNRLLGELRQKQRQTPELGLDILPENAIL